MKILFTALSILLSFSGFAQTRLEVIKIGHPTLRAEAQIIDLKAITKPSFQTLIENMIYTMKKSSGVGLAAPQVNESIRMFVMKSAFQVPLTVVINPTVEYLAEYGQQDSVEGCLSIPGQTLKVKRFNRIRMSYYNREGNFISEEVKGFKAIISQHEYDHLNGVLIVDLVQSMMTQMDFDSYVTAPLM